MCGICTLFRFFMFTLIFSMFGYVVYIFCGGV